MCCNLGSLYDRTTWSTTGPASTNQSWQTNNSKQSSLHNLNISKQWSSQEFGIHFDKFGIESLATDPLIHHHYHHHLKIHKAPEVIPISSQYPKIYAAVLQGGVVGQHFSQPKELDRRDGSRSAAFQSRLDGSHLLRQNDPHRNHKQS